jgi:hypothetical protein
LTKMDGKKCWDIRNTGPPLQNSKASPLIIIPTDRLTKFTFPNYLKSKKLVRIFEQKFPEITVSQVWLIWKSSTESEFQAWHQDKVGLQTKTIMVNVGSAAGDPVVNYNPEFGEDSNCIDLNNYRGSEKLVFNFVMEGGRKK